MGDIVSLLRNARNLAVEKHPLENPLIVRTGHYTSAVEEREILGIAIKAPFGSGKTFGIALKSYHDSRLGQHPMEDTKVVALRARELVHKDEYFDRLIKELKNIMCGGLLVSALRFVSARYEKCVNTNDSSCYTTLTRQEAEGIATLLGDNSLGKKLEKGVTVDVLAELLRNVKRDVLGGKNLAIIIDEVEGFLTGLNLRASDVVYSNLAMMAKIYDQGIWGAKLIVLLQNKVIDDDWTSMIKRIKEGRPYVSKELRGVVEVPGETSIYVCPVTKERLDVSALMGRVKLLSMAYYRGNVYAEYARLAFNRITELKNALSADIVEAAKNYTEQLNDFYANEEVSQRLAFLESIAPRISFDYMDELIENMLRTGKDSVREALDTALRNVAEEWSKYDDIRKFYSKIIIKKIPRQRSTHKNVSVFRLVSAGSYSKIVETFAKDLYSRVVSDVIGVKCRFDPRSARYHSNYIAVVSCLIQNKLFSGVLILRTTTGKPSGAQKGRTFVIQLASRISSLIRLTTWSAVQVQQRNVRHHEIIGLMLVPEGVPSASYLELEMSFTNMMNAVRSKLLGNPIKTVSIQPILHQIKDEDFIIIVEKTLEKEHGISMIDQFVDERYRDILAWLAGKIRANISWGV